MGFNRVLLLAHVILVHITFGSEVIVQVNTKKWIYYVPERFLSLTVDPLTLAAASPLTQESFNLAKGLSPSFVRLGGIGTNAVYFGKQFMENSTTVSESQWDSVNEFAKNTGLDIIASLNPSMRPDGVWDSQNSQELISYSAKKHYGVAWQLGYDMRGYNASGAEVGKDLVKLKKMLEGVSNYASLPVFGPDVTSVNGAKQIHFIKDLISNAGNPLACLIIRPNFKNDAQPEDPYDLMASMTSELDTYVWNKDARLGKSTPKKPVWIAEPVASQGSFEEAMKFVKRIGHAARLGVQVYLRQAGISTLKSPTPDYWFSLMYKTLVGQGVLDYKIVGQNQTGLHVFTHCTAAVPQEKSVLDSDWNYEKGAVTLFGVNESPEPTKLVLRVTNKEEPIHIYTLTSAKKNDISAKSMVVTLLNGQELKLSPTGNLPVLSPKVKKPSKSSSLMIPGDSIFFVVMPDSKVRTCSLAPLTAPDLNLSELTKRLRLGPQRKSDESKQDREEEEEAHSEEGVYVSFTKKRSVKQTKDSEPPPKTDILGKNLMRTIISKLAPRKIDLKTEADQEEMPVKYITFNENSFLNKLAEGVKEEIDGSTTESDDGKANKKSRVEYKYPALTSAIKNSTIDKIPETSTMKTLKSDITSSAVSDDEKIQVISIKPLDPGDLDDGKTLSRSRRSSREESPVESASKDSESMKIIESILEAKKEGKPLNGEMSDVDKNLNQHDVTWKLSPDDPEEKARNARHASLEQTVNPGSRPPSEEFSGEQPSSLKTPDASGSPVLDSEDHKPRNVRHAGDASEEQESTSKTEAVKAEDTTEKDIETETLAKIVEKTEQISSVSESPQVILVPEEVPQEKLEGMMLKAAKSNSDPEPNGSLSKDDITNPPLMSEPVHPVTMQPAESVPVLILPSGQHNTLLIEQPLRQNSPLPGQFNPMLVPSKPNPGTIMNQGNNNQINMPPALGSDPLSPSTKDNSDSVLISPISPVIPGEPYYNEKKENTISKILTKIVTEEDSVLAKMPTDGLKQGMVADLTPSEVVPINVEGHTMLIAPADLKALRQPDVEGSKLEPGMTEKSTVHDGKETDPGTRTLEDSGEQLDLASEVGSQDAPSVKVARQVTVRLPISPISATATPKAATATLAAPLEEPAPTTPGPVSLFPAPKETKLSSVNQLPQVKAPTPEELRERYKVLRERMLELRQQYLEARDKRLEEFRKQVAVARTTPDAEDTIKSTIKRREAELKEWFKKFDKREIDPAQPIPKPDLAKSRPRRLSMFTNDENLDMEKFFEDDPVESYNYKRSPEIVPPQQQFLPQPEVKNAKKTENVGRLLIPLDSKSPQGIVYNNRIYPARLFGYIDPQNSYGEFKEPIQIDGPKEMSKYGEYRVRETADISTPITRERLAYVPKDAFIKEFKSDFVPVVLLDPEETSPKSARSRRSTLTRSKRSILTRPKISTLTRSKRSTLTDLEEQLHHVKDEIFPKISSWIKNLSDHPPWKRDLASSRRARRSMEDVLLTNDLRSLKYLPKVNWKKDNVNNAPKIEEFVWQNIDKGENDVFKVAKEYTGLAEKIDKSLTSDEPNVEESTENGYCIEIGTSGKSVIRDPFIAKSKKSNLDSIEISKLKSHIPTSKEAKTEPKEMTRKRENYHSNSESLKSLENGQDFMKVEAGQSNDEPKDGNGETTENPRYATIVADGIRAFFTNVKEFFGATDR